MFESAKYKALCPGDGPDVLMCIEMILGRETGKKFFFDLTPPQARVLAAELNNAADIWDQAEKDIEEYFKKEKETIYNSHSWVNTIGGEKCSVCGQSYSEDYLPKCGTVETDMWI